MPEYDANLLKGFLFIQVSDTKQSIRLPKRSGYAAYACQKSALGLGQIQCYLFIHLGNTFFQTPYVLDMLSQG